MVYAYPQYLGTIPRFMHILWFKSDSWHETQLSLILFLIPSIPRTQLAKKPKLQFFQYN